jgi:hypothetical protein
MAETDSSIHRMVDDPDRYLSDDRADLSLMDLRGSLCREDFKLGSEVKQGIIEYF